MTTPLRSSWMVLAAAVLAAGCKSSEKPNDALAQDSSLSRDLQLANRDTTVQPQLRDVPANAPPSPTPAPAVVRQAPPPRAVARAPQQAPVPVHTRPTATASNTPPVVTAPAPAPTTTASGNTVQPGGGNGGRSEGRVGTVAAGTSFGLAAGQRLCTNTNSVGDRITATLANSITASNGIVIPAGATATVEVTSLARSTGAGENMSIGLVVRSITWDGRTYPVDGEITDAQTERVRASDNNDAAKVGGGAVVGAILGRVIGGRNKTKGTIIGAAGGAAAGAILANQTAKYDACIPSGGRISVRLDSPMSVQGTPQPATSAPGVI